MIEKLLSKIENRLHIGRVETVIFIISLVFLLVSAIFVRKEHLWFPFTVFGLILLYFVLFYTDKVLYLIAFLTPLSVPLVLESTNSDFGLSFPSEGLMILIMVIFIIKTLHTNSYTWKITVHPISILIILYLVWMLITSATSTMPMVSFKFLLCKLWFIIPFFFFLAQLAEKNIKNIFTFFFAYASGLAIVVIRTSLRHMQMGDVRKVSHWVMEPYYNDHTAYGAVLAFFVFILAGMMFIPTLTKKQRLFAFSLLIPISLGLFLSFSRAAWLSVIFALGIWLVLLLKIRFRTLILTFAAVFLLLFSFQDTILYQLNKNNQESSNNFAEHFRSISNISSDASNVERINRWTAAIGMFKEKPVVGFGPGTYQFNYAPYQNPKYKTIITTNAGDGGNAHSEYLGPLSEMGFLGMILMILLVFFCIYKGINIYHSQANKTIRITALMCTLALITYFTHGFLNNFLDTDKLAVPVFGAMAVITALDVYRKQEIDTQKLKENEA